MTFAWTANWETWNVYLLNYKLKTNEAINFSNSQHYRFISYDVCKFLWIYILCQGDHDFIFGRRVVAAYLATAMVALALQMSLGGQSDGCCWEAKECCPVTLWGFICRCPRCANPEERCPDCSAGVKFGMFPSFLGWKLKLRHLLVGAAKRNLGYVRITQAQ